MKDFKVLILADNFEKVETLHASRALDLQPRLYAYCIERGAKRFKWIIKQIK